MQHLQSCNETLQSSLNTAFDADTTPADVSVLKANAEKFTASANALREHFAAQRIAASAAQPVEHLRYEVTRLKAELKEKDTLLQLHIQSAVQWRDTMKALHAKQASALQDI